MVHVLPWLPYGCAICIKPTTKSKPEINPERSIALTDIRLEQIPVISYDLCDEWFPPKNYAIDFGDVFVTIKNTGMVPIQSFRINGSFDRCYFICPGYQQISEYGTASLQPGESVELHLLPLQIDGQFNSSSFDLCFWAALPDNALDGIPDDDKICETFQLMVSDFEPAPGTPQIQVMPNPAVDKMTFKIDSPGSSNSQFSIALTNVSGQKVIESNFTGPVFELGRGSLVAGVYFYEILNKKGAVARGKVIFSD